ncbi:hypothetical protein L228DRAFT_14980 [Xylona heveae TC161]|uniref:Uncharacterized protein n=1 Tax=Xylona heveae (strain CBS 132557 / TC161) TaxID=1328760 RepID=A0A165JS84_XYLHT|nr:hypothetical protein L228DRAFT_14980 [Xylona heveae TC161]KZF26561.1 hypothetical protein L228DRAFT_14980 [Xylona heveae TC161]
MTPNLYLLTINLFTPHRWFTNSKRKTKRSSGRKEHWNNPVPGHYEYIPGRGWYLVAQDSGEPTRREQVVYCAINRRWMLLTDLNARTTWATVPDERGKPKRRRFFRTDDGCTWLSCWDEHGKFVPGPWPSWHVDKETGRFRSISSSNGTVSSRSSSSTRSKSDAAEMRA